MVTTTTDPMTGHHLIDLAAAPFVIEGRGRVARTLS
jgi:hypothetical protein